MQPIRYLRLLKHDQGAALIIVLWLIVLLTLLSTAVTSMTVGERRAVERDVESVADAAIADSAIRLMLLQLLCATPEASTQLPATAQLSVMEQSVDTMVEPETGRVDLNAAPQALLFAVFAANGWSESAAQEMAVNIVHWRSVSATVIDAGSDNEANQVMGMSSTLRDGAFESVEELRQVLHGESITPNLLNAFTVYTHAALPQELVAPAEVGRTLEWADQHRLLGRRWISASDNSSQVSKGTGTVVGELLRLTACYVRDKSKSCRVAVVRLTGNVSKPYQVFAWQAVAH